MGFIWQFISFHWFKRGYLLTFVWIKWMATWSGPSHDFKIYCDWPPSICSLSLLIRTNSGVTQIMGYIVLKTCTCFLLTERPCFWCLTRYGKLRFYTSRRFTNKCTLFIDFMQIPWQPIQDGWTNLLLLLLNIVKILQNRLKLLHMFIFFSCRWAKPILVYFSMK